MFQSSHILAWYEILVRYVVKSYDLSFGHLTNKNQIFNNNEDFILPLEEEQIDV
ncbi:hypothetical protein EMIT0180MI3_30139 [Priestia megaterium]|jgi:hypothetical protein|nr:hypothetical protein [Neobacillus sp.]